MDCRGTGVSWPLFGISRELEAGSWQLYEGKLPCCWRIPQSETTSRRSPYAEIHTFNDGCCAVICGFDVRAVVQPEPGNAEFRGCGAE